MNPEVTDPPLEETTGEPEPDLQQQVGLLQHRIAELEAELAQSRAYQRAPFDLRHKIGPLLVLAAVLLLALTPPALIFLDRWLKI